MKYFHCPKTFRSKPYGCGFGPVDATTAFLDMDSKCRCGKELKTHTKANAQKEYRIAETVKAIDFVKMTFGEAAALDYAKTKVLK